MLAPATFPWIDASAEFVVGTCSWSVVTFDTLNGSFTPAVGSVIPLTTSSCSGSTACSIAAATVAVPPASTCTLLRRISENPRNWTTTVYVPEGTPVIRKRPVSLLVPPNRVYDNAFKVEWELFLRHVVDGGPFPWNLLEGAKGVQLAELGLRSWRERRFVDVPAIGA